MILYYAPTACSMAPHIALEESGLDFDARALDLAKGDQTSEEYRRVNPAGRVPALILDGQTITEVPALLTYIAAIRPEARLVPPPGTLAHARCFEWLGFLSSTVHIAYAQFRRPTRFLGEGSECLEPLSTEGRQRTIQAYREVEQRLGRQGPWAAGEAYSIADMYLFPFFTWAWRLDFPIATECPAWAELFERTKARPAVQRVLAREGLSL